MTKSKLNPKLKFVLQGEAAVDILGVLYYPKPEEQFIDYSNPVELKSIKTAIAARNEKIKERCESNNIEPHTKIIIVEE